MTVAVVVEAHLTFVVEEEGTVDEIRREVEHLAADTVDWFVDGEPA